MSILQIDSSQLFLRPCKRLTRALMECPAGWTGMWWLALKLSLCKRQWSFTGPLGACIGWHTTQLQGAVGLLFVSTPGAEWHKGLKGCFTVMLLVINRERGLNFGIMRSSSRARQSNSISRVRPLDFHHYHHYHTTYHTDIITAYSPLII